MPEVSVIIPVYNAEKYLAQCLDSVLAQSGCTLELICVDDGSTDSSPAVLQGYAAADSRVKLVWQQNRGAGAARNAGIEKACGDYLLFMDADDFLCPDGLAAVVQAAGTAKADVLRCRSYDYDNRNGERSLSVHNGLTKVPGFLFGRRLDYKKAFWVFPKMTVAPWGGIIRREYVTEQGLRFNSLRCVNDRSFYWDSILHAKRILLSDTFLVNYRIHVEGSLIAGRIKHFDCEFASYRMIEAMCAGLPRYMKRNLMNGELQDIANWLEEACKTSYKDTVMAGCRDFFATMDTAIWGAFVKQQRWYRRIERTMPLTGIVPGNGK